MLIGETPIGEPPGIGDSFVVRSCAYDMDLWVIFTGSEPLEGGEIRYYLNRQYNTILKKSATIPYTNQVGVSNINSFAYKLDVGLLKALASAYFDIVLRPSYEATIPSTPVISALVWSYTEILDAVWRHMDTMSRALKLEHAQGTDLDNSWGLIYDLPRLVSEDDTEYRDRLKTRTRILKSSGTKENCESIIDSVLGEKNSSNVITQYPAHTKIIFNDDDHIRLAISKKSTLDILIPEMLAAGVSYDLLLPLLDYEMTALMNGPIWLPINVHCALEHKNNIEAYDCNIISVLVKYNNDQIMSAYIQNYFEFSYLVSAELRCDFTKNYAAVIGLFGHILAPIPYFITMSKLKILKQYIMSSYIRKSDVTKSFTILQALRASGKRPYRIETSIIFHNLASCDFDMISRLFAASADFSVATKRSFSKRSTMRIMLVGA